MQEAERTVGVHFLGKETTGRYDFGGICRKILEGEEVLLSGAQGLSERKRVALRRRFAIKQLFGFLDSSQIPERSM